MSAEKIKKCPACQKVAPSKEKGIYPFCSKRCKMQDLDNWAAGRYYIRGEDVADSSEAEDSSSEEDFDDITSLK